MHEHLCSTDHWVVYDLGVSEGHLCAPYSLYQFSLPDSPHPPVRAVVTKALEEKKMRFWSSFSLLSFSLVEQPANCQLEAGRRWTLILSDCIVVFAVKPHVRSNQERGTAHTSIPSISESSCRFLLTHICSFNKMWTSLRKWMKRSRIRRFWLVFVSLAPPLYVFGIQSADQLLIKVQKLHAWHWGWTKIIWS